MVWENFILNKICALEFSHVPPPVSDKNCYVFKKPSDSRETRSEGFTTLYKNYLQHSVRANKDLLNATSTVSTCIRYKL